MTKPITVVTATFNKGERNRTSIHSILNQTHQNFDYIIVNDGSTDNTKEILDEFSKLNDPRLKIIHQENKGFVNTMISVMNQIDTPYIAIQGAGDISHPTRLEKQLDYLSQHQDVGAVGGGFNYVNENGEILAKTCQYIEYHSPNQMMKQNIFNHGEVMMTLEAYQKAGGYRSFFIYTQDYDLWLRILEFYKIVALPECLYNKIVAVGKDISGDPQKMEKQILYSLFLRFLARRRLNNISDPKTNMEMDFLFQEYIKQLDDSEKQEVINKVVRLGIQLNAKSSSLKENLKKMMKIAIKYDSQYSYLYPFVNILPPKIFVKTYRILSKLKIY